MSSYRCAICGSPNVTKVEQNDGFSYGKALVGTAVFGTIGAVAGINGKKKYVFSCPDCGNVLPTPMDDFTKDKIDVVMTNPDILVTRIDPSLYDRYAYLRKEKEMRDACAVEKACTFSTNYANPLSISEIEFRHAAKASRDAIEELWRCWSSVRSFVYYYDDPEPSVDDPAEFLYHDIEKISEGLRSLKTVTYGISAYPSLMMKRYSTDSGLARNSLCAAAVLYILLENGGRMSVEDFYSCVMNNSIYQQLFMTIFGDEYQKQYVFYRDVIAFGKPSTLNAYQQQVVWQNTMYEFCMSGSLPLRGYASFRDSSAILDFPFKLIDGLLYAQNPKPLEKQLEEDDPELVGKTWGAEQRIAEVESRINDLSKVASSPEQKAAEATILNLKKDASLVDAQIAKLRARFFFKKKAEEKILELEAKQQETSDKIAAQNAIIAKEKELAVKRREQQKVLLEKQLSEAKQSLEDLQKQKEDYASNNYSEWLHILQKSTKA